jgi:hypothetical protein
MKAHHIDRIGSIGGIVRRSAEDPRPGPKEVLMRVRASSLNYRDLMVLKGGGRGPTRLGVIPLSDGAGDVEAVGEGVRGSRSVTGLPESGQNIPKNRCRTTIAERMMETFWPAPSGPQRTFGGMKAFTSKYSQKSGAVFEAVSQFSHPPPALAPEFPRVGQLPLPSGARIYRCCACRAKAI